MCKHCEKKDVLLMQIKMDSKTGCCNQGPKGRPYGTWFRFSVFRDLNAISTTLFHIYAL